MLYWHMGYVGMAIGILFWIFLIWLIIWLIKSAQNPQKSASGIAKERYAKGEITRKEYMELKKEVK